MNVSPLLGAATPERPGPGVLPLDLLRALQIEVGRRLSGMLAGAETLPPLNAPPPVLLVHGDADQVIPPSALFMSATALGAVGVPVQWHLSKGLGHGIDPFGLDLAQKFLMDAFSGRAPRTGPPRRRPR